jgi:uncharacterized membrane protein
MVRCKVCGYLMKDGKERDRCPACGAPATAFEPYTDTMSPERRRILDFDLHPIAVHFPTTLAAATFVFSFAALFFSGDAKDLLVSTSKILSLLFPLVVILGAAVGWLDGTVRFHKIGKSKILKRKILYAAFLFVVSSALAVVVWAGDLKSSGVTLAAVLLSGLTVFLVYALGALGMSIRGSAFPGK